MDPSKLSRNNIILVALFLLFPYPALGQQTPTAQANSAKELDGLWEAKRRFGS